MPPSNDSTANWKVIQDIAVRGYSDGIDTRGCIEMIKAGNGPGVVEAMRDGGAEDAYGLVMKGLFGRLHLAVMRPFDPIRSGDRHSAVAFELLRKPALRACVPHLTALKEAEHLFDCAKVDPRLKALRHLRNKAVAHLSKRDPAIAPLNEDLLLFALHVCEIWEKLAYGTGVIMISLDVQNETYVESAAAFWRPWTNVPTRDRRPSV